MILPDSEPVSSGPFKRLRHPNYLAVIIEFAALPLVHSAWVTAVVFSLANAAVLARRIRVEEVGLRRTPGYEELLGGRPRIFPGGR